MPLVTAAMTCLYHRSCCNCGQLINEKGNEGIAQQYWVPKAPTATHPAKASSLYFGSGNALQGAHSFGSKGAVLNCAGHCRQWQKWPLWVSQPNISFHLLQLFVHLKYNRYNLFHCQHFRVETTLQKICISIAFTLIFSLFFFQGHLCCHSWHSTSLGATGREPCTHRTADIQQSWSGCSSWATSHLRGAVNTTVKS